MNDRQILHLRNGGTSVVLDVSLTAGPAVVYWGRELSASTPESLRALALAAVPQPVSAGLDDASRLTAVATPAQGWLGTPAVEGHRGGRSASLRLALVDVRSSLDATSSTLALTDPAAGVAATLELAVTGSGLFKQRLTLSNTAPDDYTLQSAMTIFPIPWDATELLDLTGRHLHERVPQRHELTFGTYLRESRGGRPGADSTLVLVAGRPGFGFERGQVHGIHVAWSGNSRVLAERAITGESFLAGGELLLPGEIVLASGQEFQSPWILGSWGDGLSELAHRFHGESRARPGRPTLPRPISLNTWEAVYFRQSQAKLAALADAAAAVGVERFVLDDGWFLGRRDDTAGLGDWTVDPDVWPDGLHPLIDHVVGLGMQFGLWVEPEMVNVDSELARSHPDWLMRGREELPPPSRNQQVLRISEPGAWEYLAKSIDALLTEYPISYLKWDHNRSLVDAADGAAGRAAVHEQTLALYRLMDWLKARHPELEIESCASGGARVDLGILSRCDRIWVSDSLDPFDRLAIQRYTGLLVAPEMMGMHVSAPIVEATGRATSLDLSAGVALFGHFGIEWDISEQDEATLERLSEWVALAKRVRSVLIDGWTVDVDGVEAGIDVRGVVSDDRSQAFFTIVQTATSVAYPSGMIRIPALDPDSLYMLSVVQGNAKSEQVKAAVAWSRAPIAMTGRELEQVGIRAPVQRPGAVTVIEFQRQSGTAAAVRR